ncbi:bifunctional folylpolyglutamate synthase/dihydrofolate synthase [Desulfolithobacter dissulfuricans]|uniref:Dihydrofolate synthase/folylpolyglutamate synthase n=1 Tax=Desulfolithobacter dissulfuricans TaxID=2795293 RepID=A0A915XHR4_9BACT|nr:folylpolyglutamate synthase/dihydrofolate synthase family protein [Desulfolithobacter dissulfuricans]BCO08350.1 bifunctional folylpolyglutamate synthase/dihydrofolate synthase [Desulfolithobacter dissulfuricans]
MLKIDGNHKTLKPTMNYNDAWTFLDQLQFFKIKLGLDAMHDFLDRLDNPQQELACIHIGGTNGKGSVGATLTTILTRAGYRVGFYTSPHLSCVRERFRIGDRFISEQEFARQATRIRDVLDGSQITYFEFTTALALGWFAEQRVDLAILEVGMGGRLDATNVVTPLVSVITNVSMDHEQYLGTTLTQVAREKAGIIKQGIPVVCGVADREPLAVMEETCNARSAPLYLAGRDFHGRLTDRRSRRWQYLGPDGTQLDDLPLAMKGGYQVDNAAMALATIQLLGKNGFNVRDEHIRAGLAATRWPGRLEEFWRHRDGRIFLSGPVPEGAHHFLLDGAHNPAGVEALRQALDEEFSHCGLILVWGAMADKDLGQTLEVIAPLARTIIFTRPESERSATSEQLADALPPEMRDKTRSAESVAEALDMAMELAGPGELICIGGSLYLVGAARRILLGELCP